MEAIVSMAQEFGTFILKAVMVTKRILFLRSVFTKHVLCPRHRSGHQDPTLSKPDGAQGGAETVVKGVARERWAGWGLSPEQGGRSKEWPGA